MHGAEFLKDVGIILLLALLGGLAAKAVRLPIVVGYLLTGIVIGPHTPGFIADQGTVRSIADFGVALLMFAVGVQFSLEELKAVQRLALIAGAAHIVGTILLGVIAGMAFGWDAYGGLFLGCALSLSSTAIIMRTLEERGEMGAAHGTLMLGISVVQDLTLVTMIALLPALAMIDSKGAQALISVLQALLKGSLFIGATLLFAAKGVPALLDKVANTRSHELFLLTALSICLLAGILADMAGLGLALGAFLAGVVVSESPYSYEVFSQVRPLRDVFASLFFVSIGMLLNPASLVRYWGPILAVLLIIVVGKVLLTMFALYWQGVNIRTSLKTGVGLAQIGEFSFVLATLGSSRHLIPEEISHVILASALISILLTPFLFSYAEAPYRFFVRYPVFNRLPSMSIVLPPALAHESESARVVIIGCGRIGRYVSDALRAKQVPHVVVDYDSQAVTRMKENNVPVFYGDASSPVVLSLLNPKSRELAIVTLPEAASTELVIKELRKLAPTLPIVARVHRGQDIPRMRTAGADAVIHAEFEAGTEMIRQGLDRLGFLDQEVDSYIEGVRQHRYRQEKETFA